MPLQVSLQSFLSSSSHQSPASSHAGLTDSWTLVGTRCSFRGKGWNGGQKMYCSSFSVQFQQPETIVASCRDSGRPCDEIGQPRPRRWTITAARSQPGLQTPALSRQITARATTAAISITPGRHYDPYGTRQQRSHKTAYFNSRFLLSFQANHVIFIL